MKRAVELFVGAGGLGMGVSRAGFKSALAVEIDRWACKTIRLNKARKLKEVVDWRIHEGDAADADYGPLQGKVDLVVGGPPCQPFSMGGRHHAHLDARDMFPEAIRAVRELAPSAFLFENVRGLVRQTFANYFDYILLSLTYPKCEARGDESWEEHLRRLRAIRSSNSDVELRYEVQAEVLNAANFGVPQTRERVFIVGFRSDLNVDWKFPDRTHSKKSLFWRKWRTEDYWDRHGISYAVGEAVEKERQTALRLCEDDKDLGLEPWRTVRDAISDLPDPERSPVLASAYHDHSFIDGARSYKGHTGSPWDLPSKTLKAGVHGVPGGENMLRREDGTVRYFTVRESARLQTFPDDMHFEGAWSQVMRQLGNAVPTDLAYLLARKIMEKIK